MRHYYYPPIGGHHMASNLKRDTIYREEIVDRKHFRPRIDHDGTPSLDDEGKLIMEEYSMRDTIRKPMRGRERQRFSMSRPGRLVKKERE